MDSFIGEIRVFGFGYAPQDWAYCNGQVLSVGQSQVLYSIIGNYYGGSAAQQTFALPKLCSQVAMGAGTGPGLTPRSVGSAVGTESVTLNWQQSAAHNHPLNAQNPNNATVMATMDSVPTATHWLSRVIHTNPAPPATILQAYSPASPDTQFLATAIGVTGGGQAHENRQPYLAMNYCISLSGVYPVRS